jgi:cytoskeletal protein CcmA (bactofilin family)
LRDLFDTFLIAEAIVDATIRRRMRPQARGMVPAAMALAWFCTTVPAQTQVQTDAFEDNIYIAGGAVRVAQAVNGDLIAAGGKVSVEHSVRGDAMLAGGDLRIAASVGGDLRAAGGNMDIIGPIKGEVIGAGGNVDLAPGAQIGGRVRLAAGHARVAGNIAGGITIYARSIVLAGDIGGDARLVAERIEILPGARIRGRVSYSSPNAIKTDAQAMISGGVSREPIAHMHTAGSVWRTLAWIFGAVWGIGVFVAGALLILLLPRASRTVERTLAQSPWQCLGLGLALFVAIPLIAMIMMITIVGIPLAAAVLALYPVVLLLGYLSAMLFIGSRGAALVGKEIEPGVGTRVAALALTLIAFALLRALPFVGALANGIALLFGMGALALTLYRHFSTPDRPAAVPTQHQPPSSLTGSAA